LKNDLTTQYFQWEPCRMKWAAVARHALLNQADLFGKLSGVYYYHYCCRFGGKILEEYLRAYTHFNPNNLWKKVALANRAVESEVPSSDSGQFRLSDSDLQLY